MNISIARAGERIGEWPREEISSLYARGEIFATDYYWHEGMSEWILLSYLLPHLPPAPKPKWHEKRIPFALYAEFPIPRPVGNNWKEKLGSYALGAIWFTVMVLALTFGKEFGNTKIGEMIFVGAIAGLICGIVPYLLAKFYLKAFRPGLHLLPSVIGGAIGGFILGIPLALIHSIVILCKKP